jgi:Xaa-Pro aminopeptidase
MKRDLDKLMKERGIDVLIISGTPKTSRDLFYFTGPVTISGGRLIKKAGEEPILVASSMERNEAAKSGLKIMTQNDFGLLEIARSASNPLEAGVKSLLKICETLDVRGTVSFYGTGDIPYSHALLSGIEQEGAVKVHVEAFDSILSEARMTKDNQEIDRIDSVSRRAQQVMTAVREFLMTCSTRDGKIVDPEGRDVTIGRVRDMIRVETEERGMVLEDPVIFSQGRDSAIPHSCGDDEATLVPGKTIVFDYCPQETGPGYFCDITRTWCLGYVPDDVMEIYKQVLEIQLKLVDMLEAGGLCSSYDRATNEYFDEHGHATPLKGTAKTEGYVHSLGHGIGLDVHERPRLSTFSKTEERLAPGHVFTVEPGLYYPDRGIGVRIEDDIAIREDGAVRNLTGISKEILVPLR